MNPLVLLEPLSLLRHDPDQGFCDSPTALTYQVATACVRFDKGNGRVDLDPPNSNVLDLLQALQALATAQHDAEKARLLARLAERPY